MTLQDYLAQYTQTRRKTRVMQQLADTLHVHFSSVRHWCNQTRLPSVAHVLHLEAITHGQVTRYDLRPDVYGPKPIQQSKENNHD